MPMESMESYWDNQHKLKNPYTSIEEYLRYYPHIKGMTGKVAIEIGVGNGTLVKYLAGLGNEMYAVDISPVALDVVSKFATTIETSDMNLLPDSVLDYAICHLVLQHCDDETCAQIFSNTFRSLKPSGVANFQSAYNCAQDQDAAPLFRILDGPHISRTTEQAIALAEQSGGKFTKKLGGDVFILELQPGEQGPFSPERVVMWDILEFTSGL